MAFFEIGKIVNTQGVRGEIRVIPTTDDPDKFRKLEEITVYHKGRETTFAIESARNHKQFIILKLAGIDDMNGAAMLRGGLIKIPRALGVPLETDEYYIGDIYDMDVVNEDGESLGVVSDILFTGANDVYVVKKEGRKDILIPAIKQCILQVDPEAGRMIVRLMEGLVD